MKKFLSMIFISFLSFSCAFTTDFDTWQELHQATVLSIIDGDTIEIRFEEAPQGCNRRERVRLIGIDTPELFTLPAEYYSYEAFKFTTDMLSGKEISIELDKNIRDKYGRLLAYVRLPNSAENQKLFKPYCDVDSITSTLNNNTFLFNEAIILAGFSYYYDYFSFNQGYMNRFASAEEMAEVLERGLWK